MFSDYVADWVDVKDLEIQDSQYKWMKRFAVIDFDETVISSSDLEYDLRDLPNHIRVLTLEEAKTFIANETTLTELSEGTYEISPESEIMDEVIPQKLLILT